MKIALVIFTKNERKNSEVIFLRIPFEKVNSTYVIDGNSNDGTVNFWESKKIKVFGQKYKGVGGAYESAFRNIKDDALVFFHPDGNMDPNDIARFVSLLKEGAQFIIASRTLKGGKNEEDEKIFKYRKWSMQIMAAVINLLFARNISHVSDLTQGYRALTKKAYAKLDIKIPNPIATDTEQVIKALKNKILITEFPTKEGKRMYGKTSMPFLKTSWENIKVFTKEVLL